MNLKTALKQFNKSIRKIIEDNKIKNTPDIVFDDEKFDQKYEESIKKLKNINIKKGK
jgi:hypothetical protein